MKTPNLEKKREHFDQLIEKYCEGQVRPYLVHLLKQAQARLWRHKLAFVQGMGSQFFTVQSHGEHESKILREFEDDHAYRLKHGKEPWNRREKMLRERLPWLVEFIQIVDEVEDKFDYVFGDIEV